MLVFGSVIVICPVFFSVDEFLEGTTVTPWILDVF